MTAPKRIQMSRRKPWRADNPDAVIVDRTTRWGNPVKVCPGPGAAGVDCRCEDECAATADHAVTRFRHFLIYPCIGQPTVPDLDEIRFHLAGRDLACWCPLDQPCHADVLLELANP